MVPLALPGLGLLLGPLGRCSRSRSPLGAFFLLLGFHDGGGQFPHAVIIIGILRNGGQTGQGLFILPVFVPVAGIGQVGLHVAVVGRHHGGRCLLDKGDNQRIRGFDLADGVHIGPVLGLVHAHQGKRMLPYDYLGVHVQRQQLHGQLHHILRRSRCRDLLVFQGYLGGEDILLRVRAHPVAQGNLGEFVLHEVGNLL